LVLKSEDDRLESRRIYHRTFKILESIYDTFLAPHVIVSKNGVIVDCNEMYLKRSGYSRVETIGALIFDRIDNRSRDVISECFETLKERQTIDNREVWIRTKESTVLPMLLSASALYDDVNNTDGYGILLIDETDIYRLNKDVEKINEELKKREQLKNEFIAIASHELRTPIQPILGFALLAKKGKISHDAAWDGVLKEARRLQQLANDILDVSRIESGELIYKMEKVSVNNLLNSVGESERADLAKDVTLEIITDEGMKDLEVELDRSRITQVLVNIVGNAIKFTQRGNIRIKGKTYLDKNRIEIIISDTGDGIPEFVLPKLFGKFVTKSVGERNKHGTGLGLFISKAIVTAHGGEIVAHNNIGGGATFSISLPIEQPKNN